MSTNDRSQTTAHELLTGPMRARAARLLAQLEGIKRKHKGEAGRRREDDVREFLDDFLPDRLAVNGGEIVATDGSVSPQMDLIVYDRLETPLLDRSESSVVVPIEGVYGVIEVSTRLDGAKLAADVAKIRAVKAMPKNAYWVARGDVAKSFNLYGRTFPHWPILGFCLGFEGAPLSSLVGEVRKLDSKDLATNLDMLCVLSRGCVANAVVTATRYGRLWGSPTPENQRAVIGGEGGEALTFFYLLAGGLLSQATTGPINMAKYLGR